MTKETTKEEAWLFISVVFVFIVIFGMMYMFSGAADRLYQDRMRDELVGGVVIDRYRDGFDQCHIVVKNDGEVYNVEIGESCYYSIEIGDEIHD